MSADEYGAPFEPFYLSAPRGERFCIFHPAAGVPRGAIIYLHPFAEEMNKARRMAALQSRMFATHGFAVLQIDLFGCGDSSGEFGEARWQIWKQDIELALQWLKRRVSRPIHLWGLRLGALLALDFANTSNEMFAGFLLWQPVINGESFITQFLRIQVASGLMADGTARITTHELRRSISTGVVLEIAGYDLSPELAYAIERMRLVELASPHAPVHWFEVATDAGRSLSPASRRVVDAWIERGIQISECNVAGEPFWQTVEITECPALLEATIRVIVETQ